tara:strand:+ start:1879 stop:2922 length:1044 start_codon:yes stop_codon:yes gene_type:complete
MSELQSVAELPSDYIATLEALNLKPLWPSLRALLPEGEPAANSVAAHWRYTDIRPLLLQAGELTPIEKAERRVLVLCNPGLGLENLQATPSIYVGMQLILPGEDAPNHRHTPSAIRLIVEGKGGFTTVEGEKLPMEHGDLILTPPGLWHEHGHEGEGPVVWMDALDLPFIYALETSFAEIAPLQNAKSAPDASQTRFTRSGLVPYDELGTDSPYPMRRYPWTDTRDALMALSKQLDREKPVHLAYINPLTGEECLPFLGFSALMLRPGESLRLPRRSCSQVLHVVEGSGVIDVNGSSYSWEQADVTAAPAHARITLQNSSSTHPAFLFLVDDAPLHRKLKIYMERDW